jgi:lactate dehydrogenase-like 2-hydroxyacid dehydrogenase
VIEACPNRKLICAAFTGIDHVDQEAGKARGIILHNAAGYAVHAASESANGLMVVVLRRIVSANTTILTGSDNRELTGHELFRKTLGGCWMRCHRVTGCPPGQRLWLPGVWFRKPTASDRCQLRRIPH